MKLNKKNCMANLQGYLGEIIQYYMGRTVCKRIEQIYVCMHYANNI